MSITYELKPYQQALIDKMQAGGFKQGELAIFSAGRQAGKSMLNQIYGSMTKQPKFSIATQAQVDGVTWYTVVCNKEVSAWLRSHPKELQYQSIEDKWFMPTFDIHEKLYTLLALRWS